MKKWIFVLACLTLLSTVPQAGAWPFRGRTTTVTTKTVVRYTGTPQQVAQAKAARMAELGARGHLGGGFANCSAEGTGRGTTAAAALSACCFTGQRACAAAAVVRGRNGLYYAVKLFW